MKKLTILFVLTFLVIQAFCQMYFPPEDFSGTNFPPDGWTIDNGGASATFLQGPMPLTTEPPCAYIETSSNLEVDDRLISPSVYLPDNMTAKLYAQLRGSVGYALAMYWDPDNEVRHYIEVSNDGGNTWDIVLDLDDQAAVQAAGASWPWPDWEWFDVAINIDAYAGDTIMFAYHHEKEHVPSGGGSFGVTNFGIWEDIENDIQLLAMDMPEYSVVDEEVEIGGTLKNIGTNDITSFDGEYRVDGVVAETFSISGINIQQFEDFDFIAGDPYTFTNVDNYDVELVITQVNVQPDPSPDNNSMTRHISVASGSTDRKPLFEMFTSSTCGTCPGGNETLDEVLFANPPESYSLVKYQMDWPGLGDPYYIEEGGTRKDFYGVGGIPHMFTNGKSLYSSYDFNQGYFNLASSEEAYVDITLDYDFDGINLSASFTADPMINIQNARGYFAIVEKTTYNNIGTNGETEFKNVLMAMMPDGYGDSTQLFDGVSETFTGSTNLLTTFIEEFEDLMIVVWLQDVNTQSVLQSESNDLQITTGIEEGANNTFNIYPNPNQGVFNVYGGAGSTLEISDMGGKLILRTLITDEFTKIDISNYEKGIYLAKLIANDNSINVKKIIVK